MIDALKEIEHFLPRYSLLVFYRAYFFLVLDHGYVLICSNVSCKAYRWLPQDHIT